MRGSEFSADFLLKRGPFSVIRHPLYAGNFFIGLGFTVISSFKLHLLVPLYLIIFTVYYGLIIIAEEEYLEEEFGREYRDYGNRVPSFFPDFSLFRKGNFDLEFALADERDTALTVLTVILIFSIKFLITHSPSLLTKVQLLLLIASR